MPGGMNGVELAQQIAKDYPDLPVVLTTGYYNAVDKPLPRGLPVVRKPYDIAELKKALLAATTKRQQQKRAASPRPTLVNGLVTSASAIDTMLRRYRPM